MISFIISSNSNIQKIKNSLEKITKKFGTKVTIQNKEFFLFPKPDFEYSRYFSRVKKLNLSSYKNNLNST